MLKECIIQKIGLPENTADEKFMGCQIDNIQLISKIASNSRSAVFHGDSEGKMVSIKIFEEDSGQLAEAEIDIISSLNHPNIIKMLSSGKIYLSYIRGGTHVSHFEHYYLIMNYANGGTLKDKIKKDNLDDEYNNMMIKRIGNIATGLGEMHDKNIVHRDIKPSNILINNKNDAEEILIADFDYSKRLKASNAFISNVATGTIFYMPPEQFLNILATDSDLYSLGVVAFECLTGVKPFNGDFALDIMAKHQLKNPPAFNAILLQKMNNALAGAEEIVNKALTKDYNERRKVCGTVLDWAEKLKIEYEKGAAKDRTNKKYI